MSAVSSSKCYLLDLPRELRNLIYDYTLVGPYGVVNIHKAFIDECIDPELRWRIGIVPGTAISSQANALQRNIRKVKARYRALSLTCHQLHAEARHEFFQRNTFIACITAQSYIDADILCIPDSHASQIRHLLIYRWTDNRLASTSQRVLILRAKREERGWMVSTEVGPDEYPALSVVLATREGGIPLPQVPNEVKQPLLESLRLIAADLQDQLEKTGKLDRKLLWGVVKKEHDDLMTEPLPARVG